MVECSFFIPLRRDKNLSDGTVHPREAWDWLDNELFARFNGGTKAPGEYEGYYHDADTGQRVSDVSYRFIIAVPTGEVDTVRSLLAAACVIFAQKCIYLSVGGDVEFIEASHGH
jgi:hypothetical protein